MILAQLLLPILSVVAPGNTAQCQDSKAPTIAHATLVDGREVRITPGALQVGTQRFTRCDILPGGHPLSLAVVGNEVFVGFRDVGLQRFDGARFAPLKGLPNTPMRALAAGSNALWIGTANQGLWWLAHDSDNLAQRFVHPVLGKRGITALAYRGDTLHVGSAPRGHWRIDGEQVVLRLSKEPVGCFAASKRVVVLPPGTACPSASPPLHVTAMAVHQGTLFVAMFDQGLVRKQGDVFVPVPGAPRFINALLSVGNDLYLGTAEGLFRKRSKNISRLELGLPSEHINALAKSSDETLWIATSRGVAGLGPRGNVQLIAEAQGLPSRIAYSVATTEDGALWIGTAAGVLRIHNEQSDLYSQASGSLPHDWVTSLWADGNKVYAGTYDSGVTKLAPGGQSQELAGLAHIWVNPAGVRIVDGQLVVATLGDGLWFHDGHIAHRSPRLPSADVTAMLRYEGKYWVGTRAGLATMSTPEMKR